MKILALLVAFSFIAVLDIRDQISMEHNKEVGCETAYIWQIGNGNGTVFMHCPDEAYENVWALMFSERVKVVSGKR